MSATVNINELPPDVQAKVLKQIEPTESIYREALAQRIVDSIGTLSVKLRELEDDIRQLWVEFENLKDGETILGCATKKEFCEQHLHRTPRAVQYLLNGRTTRSEQCSPVVDDLSEEAPNSETDLFEALENRLTVLLPTGHDGELRLASLLEEATQAASQQPEKTVRVIFLLREVAKHFAACAEGLESCIQVAEVVQ